MSEHLLRKHPRLLAVILSFSLLGLLLASMVRVKVQYFDRSGNGFFVSFCYPFTLRQNPSAPMIDIVDIGHKHWRITVISMVPDASSMGSYRMSQKAIWGAD